MEADVPHSTSNRPTFSCIRCAARKVKCDRRRPCSTCVKHNVDCVFHPPRIPHKRRRITQKQILTDQISRYQALLQQQDIDTSESTVDQSPASTVPQQELPLLTPSSIASEPSRRANKTQVVQGQGRSRLLDNTLWTRVAEEFHDPEEALEDSSNESIEEEVPADGFDYVLTDEHVSAIGHRHPLTEHILLLWKIFVERVQPLTKVVHVPSLQPAIQKAAGNSAVLPRGFEALMFAIYSMAIVSLKDEECNELFDKPRKRLLSRYIAGTKAALSRANFMGTTSLIVLQALLLHILALREVHEPRAIWSVSGIGIRIAQRMGFERDGTVLNLAPFETEMRRRIWWLLRLHDFRIAELCGLAKFRDMEVDAETTKWPINVDEGQLRQGMTTLPSASTGLTDSSFITLRSEFTAMVAASVARFKQDGKPARIWERHLLSDDTAAISDAFKELEEKVEIKYLRYCDPSQPLHLMVMLGARYAMNVVRFMTRHPRRWASIEQTPTAERERIWQISVNLLEQHNMVQSSPQLSRFAWHAPYFMHWHAFIHVLDTLRVLPLMENSEHVWQLIGTAYRNNPDMIHATKEPINAAVGNLCLKAYSAREAALQKSQTVLPPLPDFISKLSQQHEVAKSKRRARAGRTSHTGDAINSGEANTEHLALQQPVSTGTSELRTPSDILQNTGSSMPNFAPSAEATEYDSFWIDSGFDDSRGGLNYALSRDWDSTLTQDHDMTGNAAPSISWDQWDAWLTESRTMPSLSSTNWTNS